MWITVLVNHTETKTYDLVNQRARKKKLMCGTINQHCLLLADYKVLHLIFTRTGLGSICIIFELDSYFCHASSASSAVDELDLQL